MSRVRKVVQVFEPPPESLRISSACTGDTLSSSNISHSSETIKRHCSCTCEPFVFTDPDDVHVHLHVHVVPTYLCVSWPRRRNARCCWSDPCVWAQPVARRSHCCSSPGLQHTQHNACRQCTLWADYIKIWTTNKYTSFLQVIVSCRYMYIRRNFMFTLCNLFLLFKANRKNRSMITHAHQVHNDDAWRLCAEWRHLH